MENNFIPMAALAGHALPYRIGSISKYIIYCVQLYITNSFTNIVNVANVAIILLFNFCEQKFVQHGPITIAIDCSGCSLLFFEEKFPNYVSAPKFAPNRDSF